ncbi:MAG: hypothetical protein IPI58_00130 [Alphaproteobacteria bacterium]|nr:MAG: hypothetical protein IPI58_00130 [Alphaproteobacteria bacterium]
MTIFFRYGTLCAAAFLACSLANASPAQAAGCYEPSEAEAESALRLHSELMVTAITCLRGAKGEDLIKNYTSFTRKNLKNIKKWEQVMLSHYRSQGGGTADLDRLRTTLANDISQRIATVASPAAYCTSNGPRLIASLGWSEADLQHEVGAVVRTAAFSKPKCGQQATAQAESPASTPHP